MTTCADDGVIVRSPMTIPRAYSCMLTLRSARFRGSNIPVHFGLQNLQGNGAGAEHGIVKRLHREPVPGRGVGLVAQLEDLELADHVRARLTGIHDVPFDLAWLDAVLDRLLACPALRVQSGVDDETFGAPQLEIQLAQPPFGIR